MWQDDYYYQGKDENFQRLAEVYYLISFYESQNPEIFINNGNLDIR